MAKYLTTMTVWHGGQPHFAGEAITLTASDAKPLLASGAIEQGSPPADAPAAAKAEGNAEAEAPAPAEVQAQAQLPVDPAA